MLEYRSRRHAQCEYVTTRKQDAIHISVHLQHISQLILQLLDLLSRIRLFAYCLCIPRYSIFEHVCDVWDGPSGTTCSKRGVSKWVVVRESGRIIVHK